MTQTTEDAARLAHQTPPATQPSATVGEVSDAELKDMTAELLSHRGERPYRILRGGTALWETWLPAMRAALRYLPATLHTPPPVATATVVDAEGNVEVDWSGPLEAVHDDGRVFPVTLFGGPDYNGHYQTNECPDPTHANTWWHASGGSCCRGTSWRIRNAATPTPPAGGQ